MIILRIDAADAAFLLARQLRGGFPPDGFNVEWYVSEADLLIGALIPEHGIWRFVLLCRKNDGSYLRVASGEGPARALAYEAMTAEAGHFSIATPPDR